MALESAGLAPRSRAAARPEGLPGSKSENENNGSDSSRKGVFSPARQQGRAFDYAALNPAVATMAQMSPSLPQLGPEPK